MGVFTVIHVLFTKKKSITERVFILVNRGAVNITNFIHEDLPFFRKQGTLEEKIFRRFSVVSTYTNFIKTITEIMCKFVTS